MKRLLILDGGGFCLDMVLRAQLAGWDCRWWDRPYDGGEPRCSGDGMVEKIKNFNEIWAKWMDWADVIYLPYNDLYLENLEPYRLRGYPIVAPSPESSAWETDRNAGQLVMKKAGLAVIPTVEFHDHDAAIAFVRKNPSYLVSKPSGDVSNDKSMSYVASGQDDLIYMLQQWKKKPNLVKEARSSGFILQEKIKGIEMAVGGWFGPGGWSKWWYENFEYKKMHNDDLGVATGEMGTLSRMVTKSKLADMVLKPLTAQLEKVGYVGYIDNNCMINAEAPWPMEFTMRDGWPTRHNITAHIKNEDPVQWMLDLVNGKDTIECVDGEVCVSIVYTLPGFPSKNVINHKLVGIPVNGAEDWRHVHLNEVKMDMRPMMIGDKVVDMPGLVTTGDMPLIVTGTGSTITAARRSAYNAIGKVKIPNNPAYRTDIGAGRMKRQLTELHKLGFARGLEF